MEGEMATLPDPEYQEAWCEKVSRRNGFIKKTKAQDRGSIMDMLTWKKGIF